MIKDATFISVWDDCFEIESECKINTETKEVFDIEMVDVSDYEEDLSFCTQEFVVADGEKYDVSHIDWRIEDEYWYK